MSGSTSPASGLSRALERIADAVASHALPVLLVVLAIVGASAWYAARTLRVHVDTVTMFDTRLPHLQRWYAFAERYPLLADPLVVVIDAPGRAHAAAAELAEAMRSEPETFAEVSAPESHPFLQRHGLLYQDVHALSDLADRLAAAQPMLAAIRADPTLPGVLDWLDRVIASADRRDPAELQTLLAGIAGEVAAADGSHGGVSPVSLLLGQASVDGADRSLVFARSRAGTEGLNPAREAIARIHALAADLGLGDSGAYRVRVTGDLALSADELELLNRTAPVTGVVSFVLVTALLLVGLRNLRLVLALCLTLLVGLICTGAFAAATVRSLNMISVAFAVMSIGLGIDFGIHLGARYRELAERGVAARSALRNAVGETGGSLLLCGLTTAVGFWAFLPTDFTGLAEFGLVSGVGILLSLAATLVALPALIAALGPTFHLRRARRSRWLDAVSALPTRRPVLVLGAAGLLTFVSAVTLPGLRFSGNPLDLRVPDSPSATAFRELLASDRDSTWSLQVFGRTPDEARRLATDLRDLEGVARATTLSDLVPSEQDAKLAILEDVSLLLGPALARGAQVGSTPAERLAAANGFGARLGCEDGHDAADPAVASACLLRGALQDSLAAFPDARSRDAALARLERRIVDPVEQRLEALRGALAVGPVALDTLPASLSGLWRARDGTWRVQVVPAGSLASDAELEAFVEGVRTLAPDVTGMAVNVLEADRLVVESLRIAFGIAAAAVVLLLVARWRRSGDVARALLPIAMAALWILGAATLLGIPLDFANVIVLPLILGIGIDSGVHMVERHRRTGTHEGLLRSSTARAILLSCCTTLASFGSLAFSPHPGMAGMGRLLALGVALTLLANLMVLPAILALTSRRGSVATSGGRSVLASIGTSGPRR